MPTTFYFSSTGNDSNAGTLESSPWLSMTNLATRLTNGEIAPGDFVRFDRAGDTLYGEIRPRADLPKVGEYITFGAYGNPTDANRRPVISNYKLLNTSGGWVNESGNIWSIDLANPATHGGYTGAANGDIGFLKVNGVILPPSRKWDTDDLAAQWDFYCDLDTDILYVYSDGNPTTVSADIQASSEGASKTSGTQVRLETSTQFIGLCFEGAGQNVFHGGASAGDAAPVSHVRIFDCEMREFGGSVLDGQTRTPPWPEPGIRGGNAVNLYVGTEDIEVAHNYIHDGWDVFYTAQGQPTDAVNVAMSRHHIHHNHISRCGQGVEWWSLLSETGALNTPDAGFFDIVYEDNVHTFLGYGHSYGIRPDDANDGVGVQTYSCQLDGKDITHRRNVYYDCRFAYRKRTSDTVPGLESYENIVLLRPGTLLETQTVHFISEGGGVYDIEDWAALQGAGGEDDSRFVILPTDAPRDVAGALAVIAGESTSLLARVQTVERGLRNLRGEIAQVRAYATKDPASNGGGGLWIPKKSAHYYYCYPTGSTSTYTPSADGEMRLVPWLVTEWTSVQRLGMEVTGAGSAGAVLRIVLYRDSLGIPTDLLWDSAVSGSASTVLNNGLIDGTSATVQEVTVGNYKLKPGLYWVGVANQGAAATRPTYRTANNGFLVGSPSLPGATDTPVGWRQTGVTGTPPDPWAGASAPTGSVPRIFYKRA